MKEQEAIIHSYPILSLKNTVVFPYLFVPLSAARAISIAAVEAALKTEDKMLVLVAQKDAAIELPTKQDLFTIGTRAIIKRTSRGGGKLDILVQGIDKIKILSLDQTQPYLMGNVQIFSLPTDRGVELEALLKEILELATRILQVTQAQTAINVNQLGNQMTEPLQLAYMLATLFGLDFHNEQTLLEAHTALETLEVLYSLMSHELEVLELRQKITSTARTEMDRQQREYLLRQQLRAIQDELGETNPEKSEADELRRKLNEGDLPVDIRREAEKELVRLERLPLAAPDYQVVRTYLDLILDLPWNKGTNDVIDLAVAKKILDEDHFGLTDIKDRILEHLAVLKMNPKAKPPILCFVGPPGVGKTSLGQSIARAIGRKFERMSLGGVHDEAELRGHRRTYIGSMPGRILQSIRRAGVNNPLLMLDEVDKLGHDFRGDPAAALLEILDPAQNHSFRDNYLDLPFDLSRVFFITTANTLDTIPGPLLDRMEILRLSGYSEEEKLQIAKRYLIPRRLSEAGLHSEQFQIPDEVLQRIIARFTREAGVRELERTIGRLASKVARRFAEGKVDPVILQISDLTEYLGPERFRIEKMRDQLPAGVSTGLAWTPSGGEILYVEVALMPESDELRLTGQLGDVMRESAKAAQTYLWSHAKQWGIDPSRFNKTGLHVHVPAGAIPKDGPSAGIAMVAAMVSAFTGIPCRNDFAMTGEITLSGLVLPVGGIKEKVLAARRAGVRQVVLPQENEVDLRELPIEIRNEINFIFSDRIEKALMTVLPGLLFSLRAVAS